MESSIQPVDLRKSAIITSFAAVLSALVCGSLGAAQSTDGKTESAEASATEPAATPTPDFRFAEPADESDQYVVETLLSGLDNPTGPKFQPGSPAEGPWKIFFAESGAGRIVSWSTDSQDKAPTPVVTGCDVDAFTGRETFRIGPLALEFLSRSKLAVGAGGYPNGKDVVQVYVLPEDGAPLTADKVDHYVGPIPQGPHSTSGEGNFFGLARNEDALYVASHGDDEQAWILKASISANKLADLQPFIATHKLIGVDAPTSVLIRPDDRGHYLVCASMGDTNDDRDSFLSFYSPKSGKLAMAAAMGVRDAVSLAYAGPPGKQVLYAVDFSWFKPAEGGVFRIDAADVDGLEGCRPVRIATLVRPTGVAAAPDGTLYVTAIGERAKPEDPASGTLLRITRKPQQDKAGE
jgi:hypothetical protein